MVDTVPVAMTGAPVTEMFSPDRNWACVMVIDAGALSAMTVVWGLVISLSASVSFNASPIERESVGVPPSVNAIEVMFVSAFNALRFLSNVSRRVGDGEPADDLVERRLVGQERRRRDHDRPVGRGDRGDLARIGDQRRQPRFNIRSRIVDREQHGRGVRILQLADRGRIGRQLLNRSGDLAVVQKS